MNQSTELPWDEPTTGCAEFVKWKSDNSWVTITPWSKLETLALSLLRKILEPDSKKRVTVQQIIEHKWCRAKLNGTFYIYEFTVIWILLRSEPAEWMCKSVFLHKICLIRYWVTLSGLTKVWERLSGWSREFDSIVASNSNSLRHYCYHIKYLRLIRKIYKNRLTSWRHLHALAL